MVRGLRRYGHDVPEYRFKRHRNWNKQLAHVPLNQSPIGIAVEIEAASPSQSCLPSHAEWDKSSRAWIDNEALRGWRKNILDSRGTATTNAIGHSAPQWGSASAIDAPYRGPTSASSNANSRHPCAVPRLET
jgi:hypothetical protein